MNNLKTLTALAAVMLAGLAAPMATADENQTCPQNYEDMTSKDTFNRNVGQLPAQVAFRLATPALSDKFDIEGRSDGTTSTPDGDLSFAIFKVESDSCVLVRPLLPAADGNDYTVDSTIGGGIYYIVVERTHPATNGGLFSLTWA